MANRARGDGGRLPIGVRCARKRAWNLRLVAMRFREDDRGWERVLTPATVFRCALDPDDATAFSFRTLHDPVLDLRPSRFERRS